MGCNFSKPSEKIGTAAYRTRAGSRHDVDHNNSRHSRNRSRANATVIDDPVGSVITTASLFSLHRRDDPKPDKKFAKKDKVPGEKLKEQTVHTEKKTENEGERPKTNNDEAAQNAARAKSEYFSSRAERRKQQTLLQNLVHEEYRRTITEVYELAGGKQLGSGGFGTVQVVTRHATGKQFALKTVELDRVRDKRSFDFFIKEVEIMKNLDHPNIVRLQEVFHTPQYLFLVMDLCTGGNLLQSYKFDTERAAADIIRSVVNAIRYCHDRGIAHRDLKLDNIIFEHSGPDAVVKLVDFGLSCYTSEAQFEQDVVGTWIYMAPEVIKGYHVPTACDMWSIGVITYLLLCGYPPFTGENREKLKWQITHGTYKFHENAWGNISALAKSFITRLLVRNPQERMTAAETQHHPWLNKDAKGLDAVLPAEVAASIIKFRDTSLLKKLALKTVARAMEADQVLLLEKVFAKADSQDAGVITMGDLRHLLKSSLTDANNIHQECIASIFRRNSELRKSITFRRGSICPDQLQAIFNAVDVDNSGSLSLNDFIAASMSRRALDERRLKLAFDRLDFDHNGHISVDDLELVVGTDATGDELRAAISEFDSNGNGVIDFYEFCAAMRCVEDVGVLDMATMHRRSLADQAKIISRQDLQTLVEQESENDDIAEFKDGNIAEFKDGNVQKDTLQHGTVDCDEKCSSAGFDEAIDIKLNADAVHRASIIRSAALLNHVQSGPKKILDPSAFQGSPLHEVIETPRDSRAASKAIRSLFKTKNPHVNSLT